MLRVKNGSVLWKVVCCFMIAAFLFVLLCSDVLRVRNSAYAAVKDLPSPVKLLKASGDFAPPMLKGIYFDPKNPFDIQFLLDPGDSRLSKRKRQEQAAVQVRYFLAGLVTPAERLWVNLSPHEKDKVIAQEHETTELGRDMLKDDYLLKQFTSSLTHPDTDIGKQYWNNIDLPQQQQDNKIWIKPGKIDLYSKEGFAVIENANLSIESEFHCENSKPMLDAVSKEVNNGKNFTRVRQLYHSLILSSWFKNQVKEGLYKKYANSSKVKGINITDTRIKDQVYSLYKKSFEKGVYNLIRKEDPRVHVERGQAARPRSTWTRGAISNSDSPISNFESRISKNRQRRFFSGGMQWTELKSVVSSTLTKQKWDNVKDDLNSFYHVSVKCSSSINASDLKPSNEEEDILGRAKLLIGKKELSSDEIRVIVQAIKLPECGKQLKDELVDLLKPVVTDVNNKTNTIIRKFIPDDVVYEILKIIKNNPTDELCLNLGIALVEAESGVLDKRLLKLFLEIINLDVESLLSKELGRYFLRNMTLVSLDNVEEGLDRQIVNLMFQVLSKASKIDMFEELIIIFFKTLQDGQLGALQLDDIYNLLTALENDLHSRSTVYLAGILYHSSFEKDSVKYDQVTNYRISKIVETLRIYGYNFEPQRVKYYRFISPKTYLFMAQIISWMRSNKIERDGMIAKVYREVWHSILSEMPKDFDFNAFKETLIFSKPRKEKHIESQIVYFKWAVGFLNDSPNESHLSISIKRLLHSVWRAQQKKTPLTTKQSAFRTSKEIASKIEGLYKLPWDQFSWILDKYHNEVHSKDVTEDVIMGYLEEYIKDKSRSEMNQEDAKVIGKAEKFIDKKWLFPWNINKILAAIELPSCDVETKRALAKVLLGFYEVKGIKKFYVSRYFVNKNVNKRILELIKAETDSELEITLAKVLLLQYQGAADKRLNQELADDVIAVAKVTKNSKVHHMLATLLNHIYGYDFVDDLSQETLKDMFEILKNVKHKDSEDLIIGLISNARNAIRMETLDISFAEEIKILIRSSISTHSSRELSQVFFSRVEGGPTLALLDDFFDIASEGYFGKNESRLAATTDFSLPTLMSLITVTYLNIRKMSEKAIRYVLYLIKEYSDGVDVHFFLKEDLKFSDFIVSENLFPVDIREKIMTLLENEKVEEATKFNLFLALGINWIKYSKKADGVVSKINHEWQAILSEVQVQDLIEPIRESNLDVQNALSAIKFESDLKVDNATRARKLKLLSYYIWKSSNDNTTNIDTEKLFSANVPLVAEGVYKLPWDEFMWLMDNYFDEIHDKDITVEQVESIINEYYEQNESSSALDISEALDILESTAASEFEKNSIAEGFLQSRESRETLRDSLENLNRLLKIIGKDLDLYSNFVLSKVLMDVTRFSHSLFKRADIIKTTLDIIRENPLSSISQNLAKIISDVTSNDSEVKRNVLTKEHVAVMLDVIGKYPNTKTSDALTYVLKMISSERFSRAFDFNLMKYVLKIIKENVNTSVSNELIYVLENSYDHYLRLEFDQDLMDGVLSLLKLDIEQTYKVSLSRAMRYAYDGNPVVRLNNVKIKSILSFIRENLDSDMSVHLAYVLAFAYTKQNADDLGLDFLNEILDLIGVASSQKLVTALTDTVFYAFLHGMAEKIDAETFARMVKMLDLNSLLKSDKVSLLGAVVAMWAFSDRDQKKVLSSKAQLGSWTSVVTMFLDSYKLNDYFVVNNKIVPSAPRATMIGRFRAVCDKLVENQNDLTMAYKIKLLFYNPWRVAQGLPSLESHLLKYDVPDNTTGLYKQPWEIFSWIMNNYFDEVHHVAVTAKRIEEILNEYFESNESSSALKDQIEEDKKLDVAGQRALIKSVINLGKREQLTYDGLSDVLRVLLLPQCDVDIKNGLIRLVHSLVSSESYDFMYLSAVDVMLDVIEQNLELDEISKLAAVISEFYVLGSRSGPRGSDVRKVSQMNEQTVRRILSVADVVGGTDVFMYLMRTLRSAHSVENMDQITQGLFEEMLRFIKRHYDDKQITYLSGLVVNEIKKNKALVVDKDLLNEILEIMAESSYDATTQDLTILIASLSDTNRLVHLDKDLLIKIIDLCVVNVGTWAGNHLARILIEASLKSKSDKITKELFIKIQKIIESMRGHRHEYANIDLVRLLAFTFMKTKIDERKELFDIDNAKVWHAVFSDVPQEISIGLGSIMSNESLMKLSVDIDSFGAAAELKRFLYDYYQEKQKKKMLSVSQLETPIPEQAHGIYKLQWDEFCWIMENHYNEIHDEDTLFERMYEISAEYHEQNEASSALWDQIEEDKKLDVAGQRAFIESVVNVGDREELTHDGVCEILRVLLLLQCDVSTKKQLINVIDSFIDQRNFDFVHFSAIEVMLYIIEQNIELAETDTLVEAISKFHDKGKYLNPRETVARKIEKMNVQAAKRILAIIDIKGEGSISESLLKFLSDATSWSNIDMLGLDLFEELLRMIKKGYESGLDEDLASFAVGVVDRNKFLSVSKELLNEILMMIAESSNMSVEQSLSALVASLSREGRLIYVDNALQSKIVDLIEKVIDSEAGKNLADVFVSAYQNDEFEKINQEIFVKIQNIIESADTLDDIKLVLMRLLCRQWIEASKDERKELSDRNNAKEWHAVFSDVPSDVYAGLRTMESRRSLSNLANDMDSFARAAELKRFFYNDYPKKKTWLSEAELNVPIPDQVLGIYKLPWDEFLLLMDNHYDEIHKENITLDRVYEIIGEYHEKQESSSAVEREVAVEVKLILDRAEEFLSAYTYTPPMIKGMLTAIELPECNEKMKVLLAKRVFDQYDGSYSFGSRAVIELSQECFNLILNILEKDSKNEWSIYLAQTLEEACQNNALLFLDPEMLSRTINIIEANLDNDLNLALATAIDHLYRERKALVLEPKVLSRILDIVSSKPDTELSCKLLSVVYYSFLMNGVDSINQKNYKKMDSLLYLSNLLKESIIYLRRTLLYTWMFSNSSKRKKMDRWTRTKRPFREVLHSLPTSFKMRDALRRESKGVNLTEAQEIILSRFNKAVDKLWENPHNAAAAMNLKDYIYYTWCLQIEKRVGPFYLFGDNYNDSNLEAYKSGWDEFVMGMDDYTAMSEMDRGQSVTKDNFTESFVNMKLKRSASKQGSPKGIIKHAMLLAKADQFSTFDVESMLKAFLRPDCEETTKVYIAGRILSTVVSKHSNSGNRNSLFLTSKQLRVIIKIIRKNPNTEYSEKLATVVYNALLYERTNVFDSIILKEVLDVIKENPTSYVGFRLVESLGVNQSEFSMYLEKDDLIRTLEIIKSNPKAGSSKDLAKMLSTKYLSQSVVFMDAEILEYILKIIIENPKATAVYYLAHAVSRAYGSGNAKPVAHAALKLILKIVSYDEVDQNCWEMLMAMCANNSIRNFDKDDIENLLKLVLNKIKQGPRGKIFFKHALILGYVYENFELPLLNSESILLLLNRIKLSPDDDISKSLSKIIYNAYLKGKAPELDAESLGIILDLNVEDPEFDTSLLLAKLVRFAYENQNPERMSAKALNKILNIISADPQAYWNEKFVMIAMNSYQRGNVAPLEFDSFELILSIMKENLGSGGYTLGVLEVILFTALATNNVARVDRTVYLKIQELLDLKNADKSQISFLFHCLVVIWSSLTKEQRNEIVLPKEREEWHTFFPEFPEVNKESPVLMSNMLYNKNMYSYENFHLYVSDFKDHVYIKSAFVMRRVMYNSLMLNFEKESAVLSESRLVKVVPDNAHGIYKLPWPEFNWIMENYFDEVHSKAITSNFIDKIITEYYEEQESSSAVESPREIIDRALALGRLELLSEENIELILSAMTLEECNDEEKATLARYMGIRKIEYTREIGLKKLKKSYLEVFIDLIEQNPNAAYSIKLAQVIYEALIDVYVEPIDSDMLGRILSLIEADPTSVVSNGLAKSFMCAHRTLNKGVNADLVFPKLDNKYFEIMLDIIEQFPNKEIAKSLGNGIYHMCNVGNVEFVGVSLYDRLFDLIDRDFDKDYVFVLIMAVRDLYYNGTYDSSLISKLNSKTQRDIIVKLKTSRFKHDSKIKLARLFFNAHAKGNADKLDFEDFKQIIDLLDEDIEQYIKALLIHVVLSEVKNQVAPSISVNLYKAINESLLNSDLFEVEDIQTNLFYSLIILWTLASKEERNQMVDLNERREWHALFSEFLDGNSLREYFRTCKSVLGGVVTTDITSLTLQLLDLFNNQKDVESAILLKRVFYADIRSTMSKPAFKINLNQYYNQIPANTRGLYKLPWDEFSWIMDNYFDEVHAEGVTENTITKIIEEYFEKNEVSSAVETPRELIDRALGLKMRRPLPEEDVNLILSAMALPESTDYEKAKLARYMGDRYTGIHSEKSGLKELKKSYLEAFIDLIEQNPNAEYGMNLVQVIHQALLIVRYVDPIDSDMLGRILFLIEADPTSEVGNELAKLFSVASRRTLNRRNDANLVFPKLENKYLEIMLNIIEKYPSEKTALNLGNSIEYMCKYNVEFIGVSLADRMFDLIASDLGMMLNHDLVKGLHALYSVSIHFDPLISKLSIKSQKSIITKTKASDFKHPTMIKLVELLFNAHVKGNADKLDFEGLKQIIDLLNEDIGRDAKTFLNHVVLSEVKKQVAPNISVNLYKIINESLLKNDLLDGVQIDLFYSLVIIWILASKEERKQMVNLNDRREWHALFSEFLDGNSLREYFKTCKHVLGGPATTDLALLYQYLSDLFNNQKDVESALLLKRAFYADIRSTMSESALKINIKQYSNQIPANTRGLYKLPWNVFSWVMDRYFDEVHEEGVSEGRINEILQQFYKENEVSSALDVTGGMDFRELGVEGSVGYSAPPKGWDIDGLTISSISVNRSSKQLIQQIELALYS